MESTPSHNFLKLLLFLSILHSFPPKSSATSTPLFPTGALPTKSGYLTVNSTTGSAIFYAFYEAQKPSSSLSQTPLLIWLQGGPGCSSLIGNFYELGPWRVSSPKQNVEQLALEPNSGSWNRLFGLLFLDNPIGTGFSIAASDEEIPRDQYGVAKHLFTAITSFVALDPSFKSRPIYFTGESYAGKYVPAIGYYILKKNTQLPASRQVNLAGVAIGNGLTDPLIQVATHAVNAYFSGLINDKQKSQMEELQNEAVALTKKGNWSEATNAKKQSLEFAAKHDRTGHFGHCDLRDGVVSTEAWMKKMKWEGIEKFMEAERKVWNVNGELAGYVQKWGSLSHAVVLGAGHLVPTDQAVSSQAMIEDWVLESGIFTNENIHNLSKNFQGFDCLLTSFSFPLRLLPISFRHLMFIK
ncbi:hypothetical protein F0562_033453 [Nyssa sinensis]|uniref:Carboxypeptidase n=1 Tax=Nyssa sinensis TaxID=561372 RepID=A0A5J5AFT2_9ASTE|nr:hypothetical protein F0562_033453 [Nyssa sinensis]